MPLSLPFTRKYFLLAIIMMVLSAGSQCQETGKGKSVSLLIHFIDKDSSFNQQSLHLQTLFADKEKALNYINQLPNLLAGKGYPAASVDSLQPGESSIGVYIYLGTKYNWVEIIPSGMDKKALDAGGFSDKNFKSKVFRHTDLKVAQERILDYYENNGYPFARVYLDSIRFENEKMVALLKSDRSVFYHIDSIRMIGKAKLSNKFLQRYLFISNGSAYSKEKLSQVDKKILELPYLSTTQPSDITFLGTGAVLNLYVAPRRASQVNFLVGFAPESGNSGKLQLSGDVHLDLRNLLGAGESILVKWQQLQKKSPRLNLGYTHPYIFNSLFGFDFLFDLFKKDSSYLQVNAQLGVQYILSGNQSGKVFFQWQTNSLLPGGIDTNLIKAQKKLPPNIDSRSAGMGLQYDWIKTNYRFNPRKGNEVNFTASVGIKNISPNTDVLRLEDPDFNYASLYDSIESRTQQFRIKLSGAHYFPFGKTSTLKTALNGGIYTSPEIFRNDLFQIGGFNLLRGFDEESIYASQYAVASIEYRYLIDLNSYLFGFTDWAATQSKYQDVFTNNWFLGIGLGLTYETKFGLLKLSYAIGKRDDVKFDIRESSKLHFGYINYF